MVSLLVKVNMAHTVNLGLKKANKHFPNFCPPKTTKAKSVANSDLSRVKCATLMCVVIY